MRPRSGFFPLQTFGAITFLNWRALLPTHRNGEKFTSTLRIKTVDVFVIRTMNAHVHHFSRIGEYGNAFLLKNFCTRHMNIDFSAFFFILLRSHAVFEQIICSLFLFSVNTHLHLYPVAFAQTYILL